MGSRKSLGAVAVEAFMVVFAVLVALAVDEWQEDREVAARVARAEAAIEAELRANQQELLEGQTSVLEMYRAVTDGLERLRSGERLDSAGLGGEIPDLTDAAWETARVTGTIAHMPFDRVQERSRVYRTQALADAAQLGILEAVGDVVAQGLEPKVLMELQGALFIALQIYQNLEEAYTAILDDVTPGTPEGG